MCVGLLWLGEAHAQRFIDNGDGTISDTTTGLMWEKKAQAGIGLAHDVDHRYRWSDSGVRPDGGAFTDFLGALNDAKSNHGAIVTGCFADHCDWRLPQINELTGILLSPCSESPCIDPIFGPTQSGPYWSATTFARPSLRSSPLIAWFVDFSDGNVTTDLKKNHHYYVRAVRSGL